MGRLKKGIVVLLSTVALYFSSLVIASVFELDPLLGTATVTCRARPVESRTPCTSKDYKILWLPWPLVSPYAVAAGAGGLTLGWFLMLQPSRSGSPTSGEPREPDPSDVQSSVL